VFLLFFFLYLPIFIAALEQETPAKSLFPLDLGLQTRIGLTDPTTSSLVPYPPFFVNHSPPTPTPAVMARSFFPFSPLLFFPHNLLFPTNVWLLILSVSIRMSPPNCSCLFRDFPPLPWSPTILGGLWFLYTTFFPIPIPPPVRDIGTPRFLTVAPFRQTPLHYILLYHLNVPKFCLWCWWLFFPAGAAVYSLEWLVPPPQDPHCSLTPTPPNHYFIFFFSGLKNTVTPWFHYQIPSLLFLAPFGYFFFEHMRPFPLIS